MNIVNDSVCNLGIKLGSGIRVAPDSISLGEPRTSYIPDIEKVIFNPPATIVIWKDKTKTVVKCMDDTAFDPDVGLAMCISKKAIRHKYKSTFRKYRKQYEEVVK